MRFFCKQDVADPFSPPRETDRLYVAAVANRWRATQEGSTNCISTEPFCMKFARHHIPEVPPERWAPDLARWVRLEKR